MVKNRTFLMLNLFALLLACTGEQSAGQEAVIDFHAGDGHYVLSHNEIKLEWDSLMRCRVYHLTGTGELTVTAADDATHYIVVNGERVTNFVIGPDGVSFTDLEHPGAGKGKKLELTGTATGPGQVRLEKTIVIDLYEQLPNVAMVHVTYRNPDATPGLIVEKAVNQAFTLDASLLGVGYGRHDFWLLQGGSYRNRPNWIQPVADTLSYRNYMGMDMAGRNAGGGLPVLNVWNDRTGFFIGSIRTRPTLISMPVQVGPEGFLHLELTYEQPRSFTDEYRTFPTIVGVHRGDFYQALRSYATVMNHRGIKIAEPEPDHPVYGPIWCSWGLGPDFTRQQLSDIIPVIDSLRFRVVTIDDGWFEYYGEFIPKASIFPAGDADVRNVTDMFHRSGYPIKLWFTPGLAGIKTMEQHPEWFIRNKEGKIVTIGDFGSKRQAGFLCPALPEVQDYYRYIVDLAMNTWGFDGFKMDFEITNAMGLCYADGHNHASPEESFETLPEIYRIISEESRRYKPNAILEMCPCGMFPSFYKMAYYNQPSASDPSSAWQTRHRGKVIKALMGPRTAFYGDHVERFYSKNNFASMVGVGGIPGSKFVAREEDDGFLGIKYPVYMDPEREQNFRLWLKVYDENPLAKGEYLNLYDIIYDDPETHVVRLNNTMYYAFYADNWQGEVEFRELPEGDFEIVDYVQRRSLGRLSDSRKMQVEFENYLLVKAVPVKE